MLLALAELMVVPMLLRESCHYTTPPNGDDAGAFTYTLQDSLGNTLGGTSLMLDRSLLQV
jgi:hypothetical protein